MLAVRLLVTCLLSLPSAATAAAQAVYGDEGVSLRTRDGRFSAVLGLRNQVRFTTPFTTPPDTADDIDESGERDFRLNRSRVKAEGHLLTSRLTYKFQADFVEERVRDLNMSYEIREWLQVRAGWWKVEYLLERMQSSGSQQLVDRSILDRWFTLGRQQGGEVHGRVGGKSPWGGHYYVGAFRNVDVDYQGGRVLPVWLARYEWSWAGREPEDLEQGDPGASDLLQLTVGASLVQTTGAYAFYTGAGLGESLPVPGLPDQDGLPGAADRYRTRQFGTDAALKWRGVSLQGEMHRKEIDVTSTGARQTLLGGYVMGGVLASSLWSRAPTQLELSARVAVIDPSSGSPGDSQQERVMGANWYFQGHRSKLSVDLTRLYYTTPADTRETDLRTRMQWEFTF